VKPIFIIGQHRTGSTLLKNILDANTNVSMAFDEMNLFEPFRDNTLDKFFKKENPTSDEIVDLIKKSKIYGTFWKEFEKSGIYLRQLEKRLEGHSKIRSCDVLSVILFLLKENSNVSFSGIKYPLHFKKLDYLLKYWTDAKIIFLTRNPKAIIASKLNDEATRERKKKSIFYQFFIHYFTLLYFSLEYVYSIRTFFKNKDRLKLITYEQLVRDQEDTVKNLCDWIGLNFEEEMLQVTGKSSSHIKTNQAKLHTKSIDKYKTVLNIFDSSIISILTGISFKKVKDELSTNL
jgi:hypothetical protein